MSTTDSTAVHVETNQPAVRAVNVKRTYGNGDAAVQALDDVSVEFEQGKFTAIMGPSGSGKSTLMHVMAGLDKITAGELFIGDTQITSLKEKQLTAIRRDRIGFVFQTFNLIPTLTAQENIELPIKLAGKKTDSAWFDTVIKMVDLRNRLSHKPSELSGGQQQRVAVARALVSKPQIIFADEPTGNLDSRSGTEVLKFLREAVDTHGQTIVMVTHDANAASYADRAVFLSDGKVVDDIDKPTRESLVAKFAGPNGTTA